MKSQLQILITKRLDRELGAARSEGESLSNCVERLLRDALSREFIMAANDTERFRIRLLPELIRKIEQNQQQGESITATIERLIRAGLTAVGPRG